MVFFVCRAVILFPFVIVVVLCVCMRVCLCVYVHVCMCMFICARAFSLHVPGRTFTRLYAGQCTL